MIHFLTKLSNRQKKAVQQLFDGFVLFVSFALAMALRVGDFGKLFEFNTWALILPIIPITLLILFLIGVYRPIVRYISTSTFFKIGVGVLAAAPLLYINGWLFSLWMPRTVPMIYVFVGVSGIVVGRLIIRSWFRLFHTPKRSAVLVYGAGKAGQQLLTALRQSSEFHPVAVIDDNPNFVGKEVNDVRVYGPGHIASLMDAQPIRHVLLAIDAISVVERRKIVDRFAPFDVEVRTIPAMADVIMGRAEISDTRQIRIEDLLGRDAALPNDALLRHNIDGRAVMVTGAGGSIGSELCRQIRDANPKRLVLVDVSEYALYAIDLELKETAAPGTECDVIPVLASVNDRAAITRAMRDHGIETVLHAAAYKHVPMVEQNVISGIRNNIFGTHTVLDAALEQNVGSFTLVSTDKAVRPTNIMGASKRVAELICQAYAKRKSNTLISIVRFGNVLGSSGSVVPRFREQIAQGGPVTVTDPDITRFFMTIPEASQLVLQASGMAKGGDTFLLDMGEPVLITKMATRMISLSGSKPYAKDPDVAKALDIGTEGDIEISFTGLRPGEKLYEELLIDDSALETDHPLIMRATEMEMDWESLQDLLKDLQAACDANQPEAIRSLLNRPEIAYNSNAETASGEKPTGMKVTSFKKPKQTGTAPEKAY